jgi:hypothetical protein
MRFLVMVPASEQSEAGVLPTPEQLAEMGAFNEQLAKAGALLAGEGLKPTARGARITFTDGKPTVTDGPFTESKELIAGFWIVQMKSKEEAIEWMSRAPFGAGVRIELREVYELEDLLNRA